MVEKAKYYRSECVLSCTLRVNSDYEQIGLTFQRQHRIINLTNVR